MKSLLAILLLVIAGAVTRAQEAGAALIAVDGAIGAGLPACIDRFAGEATRIPAILLKADAQDVAITADILIDGGTLGAPWQKDVPFEAVRAPSHPALLEGSFLVPLADAENPALFRVEIHATASGQKTRAKLGEFGLRVVAADALPKSLARWLRGANDKTPHALLVFGRLAGLREKLRDWKVAFEDLGEAAPSLIKQGTFAIGEPSEPDQGAPCEVAEGASLLLFQKDPATPWGTAQKIVNTRLLATVNAPQPPDWNHTPSLHHLLLSLLPLHQDPLPPDHD